MTEADFQITYNDFLKKKKESIEISASAIRKRVSTMAKMSLKIYIALIKSDINLTPIEKA